MFCIASPEILKRQMLLSNGTRCQMIRLLVPCHYSRHGGQCQNSWATAESGISYISCTLSSCAIVCELLHASCLIAAVMASLLAGVCTVSGHCPFTSTSLSYRDVASVVETGWYLDVYEADVVRIPTWWHILLCVFHDHLITAEVCCVSWRTRENILCCDDNTAEKCVTPDNGDIHSQNRNVLGLGHKTFW